MLILKNTIVPALFTVSFLIAAPVWATKTVTSPYVDEGTIEIEAKSGMVFGADGKKDGAWNAQTSIAYGVTEFWEAEIGLAGKDDRKDEDAELNAVFFESKFQLAPRGAYFLDPGIKVEYERSLVVGPDEIGAKFILAKQMGKLGHVANFGIGREVGNNSSNENEYGFSYGLSHDYSDKLALGVEWYSDFGNFEEGYSKQSHQFGPVVYGGTDMGFDYEFGILAGVSNAAPDAQLKLVIGYEFP